MVSLYFYRAVRSIPGFAPISRSALDSASPLSLAVRSIPLRFISLSGFALCQKIRDGLLLRKRRAARLVSFDALLIAIKHYTIFFHPEIYFLLTIFLIKQQTPGAAAAAPKRLI